MQSVPSIARALYRIVFRGGTPQRLQFSTPLMLSAIAMTMIGGIVGGRFFFGLSYVEVGLVLFTLLSGLYIGSALLTRSVPRARLRASLLTVRLLVGVAGAVFVLLIPLRTIDGLVLIAGALLLIAVLSGSTNAMHYARGGSRMNAALVTLAFAAMLGAFYATLRWLLETVFS
jgi:hypothetical protein